MRKRKAMFLSELASLVASSSRTNDSEAEVASQLRLLPTIVPEWCSLTSISRGDILKVDLTMNIQKVVAKVAAAE